MGVAAHRPVRIDEHGNVLTSHPGGIRRRLPLKTPSHVVGEILLDWSGERSVNKTEKSLKQRILNLIISREAEHCENYARLGGSLLTPASSGWCVCFNYIFCGNTPPGRHTITLLFPPFWPICLTWHITITISRPWHGDGFIWKPCYSRWESIHPHLIGFSPVCSDAYGWRPSFRTSSVIQWAEPLRPGKKYVFFRGPY